MKKKVCFIGKHFAKESYKEGSNSPPGDCFSFHVTRTDCFALILPMEVHDTSQRRLLCVMLPFIGKKNIQETSCYNRLEMESLRIKKKKKCHNLA
jgi:hypothetical protein